jgi:saccharopine dehydrogenase (NAD+, L-lysine-forming)
MIGAKLMMEGTWSGQGVFCLEQLDPDPFMRDLERYGLPWQVRDSFDG